MPYTNPYIKNSRGPSINLSNFYSTVYSTSFGKDEPTTAFRPYERKSGFSTNLRAYVPYSKEVDIADNIDIGLHDQYLSTTSHDFTKPHKATGKEQLPHSVSVVGSGFTQNRNNTHPTKNEVLGVHADTSGAAAGPPRHKTYLDSLKQKDPIAAENGGHGPYHMVTEQSAKYKGEKHQNPEHYQGFKEGSGHTHARNADPITYQWRASEPKPSSLDRLYRAHVEPAQAEEPTSYQKAFAKPAFHTDMSALPPVLDTGNAMTTAFTRHKNLPAFAADPDKVFTRAEQLHHSTLARLRQKDPAEFFTVAADNKASLTRNSYTADSGPTRMQRLAMHKASGLKNSGFVQNEKPLDPSQPGSYNTEYGTRYANPGPDRGQFGQFHGHTKVDPDAFSRSSTLQKFAAKPYNAGHVQSFHPSVRRVAIMQDNC
eukprot:Colp12_sorted_trinity150504_noHs@29377